MNTIEKLKKIYNYDFSKSVYTGAREKMNFICPKHGEQFVRPNDMLNGHGCPACGRERINKSGNRPIPKYNGGRKPLITKEKFLEVCKLNHEETYEYLSLEEIGAKSLKEINLTIKCNCGNVFIQNAYAHYRGASCPVCANKFKKVKNTKLTLEEFIAKAREVHGDKYDYSLVNYINSQTKVKIICPVHGIFEQTPNAHFYKGCLECSKGISISKRRKTTEQFKTDAKNIHGDKYDYSLVNYINNKTKIRIICPKHGEFNQTPENHLKGDGCPKCKESRGEETIRLFCESNNIEYISQKRFKDCRDKNPLPFDFYLPEKNMLIEFQGAQHYYPVKAFGGIKDFEIRKKHDEIKKNYAIDNGYTFLEIKDKDLDNLENLLS